MMAGKKPLRAWLDAQQERDTDYAEFNRRADLFDRRMSDLSAATPKTLAKHVAAFAKAFRDEVGDIPAATELDLPDTTSHAGVAAMLALDVYLAASSAANVTAAMPSGLPAAMQVQFDWWLRESIPGRLRDHAVGVAQMGVNVAADGVASPAIARCPVNRRQIALAVHLEESGMTKYTAEWGTPEVVASGRRRAEWDYKKIGDILARQFPEYHWPDTFAPGTKLEKLRP